MWYGGAPPRSIRASRPEASLAASPGRPYDPGRVASSREFLRSLVGPHVLLAFSVGILAGWLRPETMDRASRYPAAAVLHDLGRPEVVVALGLGLAAATAAVLAKRLTGNTLVSACAGALLALDPVHQIPGSGPFPVWSDYGPEIGDLFAGACGLFAAGVRLLPTREIERAP